MRDNMVEVVLAQRLTQELRFAAALVEAGDPDAPAWEAEIRSRRLLAALSALIATARARRARSRVSASPRSLAGSTRV
jgi:hypothetical protein